MRYLLCPNNPEVNIRAFTPSISAVHWTCLKNRQFIPHTGRLQEWDE